MHKLFIITAFILLSSAAAAAQTTDGEKPLSDVKRVEFSQQAQTERTINATARVVDGRVLRLGPSTTYLKNGLRTVEVIRLLGKPSSVSERLEGNRLLATYTFQRSEGRAFVAEFEDGLLVSSRTESVEPIKSER